MKIKSYRKCLARKRNGNWEWSCPVWFDYTFFADAWIKCQHDFPSKEAAEDNMNRVMKQAGVTKKTELL